MPLPEKMTAIEEAAAMAAADFFYVVVVGGAEPLSRKITIENAAAALADVGGYALAADVTGDHGELTGLADDDHPQYVKADGTRAFTGNIRFTAGATIGTSGPDNFGVVVGSVQKWIFTAAGFYTDNDNALDIGATASNRPRTINVGTSVVAPLADVTTNLCRTHIIRPTGGTADNQLEVTTDNNLWTRFKGVNNSGTAYFQFASNATGSLGAFVNTTPTFNLPFQGQVAWESTALSHIGLAATDTGIGCAAAGVVTPTNGNYTGAGLFELRQVVGGGTPSTNSARIYAKDVAGTAEMHVKDEAGNETQISPHAMDGPAILYDLADPHPCVMKEVQHYLGTVRYVNISRTADLLESLLRNIAQGRTLAQIATFLNNKGPGFIDCYRVESFAQHNARLGTGLVKADWAADQAAHQARYDARRAAEIAAHTHWVEDKADHEAARAAELTAHADWLANKPAYEAARQAELDTWDQRMAEWVASGGEGAVPTVRPPYLAEPAVRAAEFRPAPTIRPVADIRKPKPAWLAARGG